MEPTDRPARGRSRPPGEVSRLASMRVWLAVTIGLIAALTAATVALVFVQRSDALLRRNSTEIALGTALTAVQDLQSAVDDGSLDLAPLQVSTERRVSVFVVDAAGTLLTAPTSRGVSLAGVEGGEDDIAAALAGERVIRTFEDNSATLVAFPLRGGTGAAIVVVPQPELAASSSIVRREILSASIAAIVVGALAGIAIATLIARRLARVAHAAAGIAEGDFSARAPVGVPDEVGALAAAVEAMRLRLAASFDELSGQRDRLDAVLDRLDQGVIALDRDGLVTYANAAARSALADAIKTGEPLPARWGDLELDRLATRLAVAAGPISARARLDDDHAFAVTALPAAADGTAMLVLSDVAAGERRERAERDFVANAAHELRTPIAAIAASVEVLRAGAVDDPEARERFLGHIRTETDRLARLARAMLILARAQTRQEAIRLVPVPVRAVLDDAARSARPQEGVSIEVDCPDALVAVSEPDLLGQAVANLVGNATKHTANGVIHLRGRAGADGRIAIEVNDTGAGIAPYVAERAFDRFYRGGDEGADGESFGLGLAIVRETVRAVQGTVDLRSEPGRGTRVTIYIPAAERSGVPST